MHVLIVGSSGSGKSALSKALAREADEAGHRVIVHDPTQSEGWPDEATKYADAEMFLEDAPSFKNAYVFIDEAADVWAADEDEANKLIYRGRHRGLLFLIIAQRSRMVRPNARNQCSTVYAFRQQFDDARTLAAEYTNDMIETTELPKLHGIKSDGFESSRLRIEFDAFGDSEIIALGDSPPTPARAVTDENGTIDPAYDLEDN